MQRITYLCFLLVLLLPLVLSTDQKLCLESIKKLAVKDKCLSSRINNKISLGSTVTDSNAFYRGLVGLQCNGTEFSCGHTMSWVSEVFQGAKFQYEEYKNWDDFDGSLSGYNAYYGDSLYNLFEESRISTKTIIYQLRHTGTVDHVWTIEQLPNEEGFRIYQSYNDAYSLNAWLSSSTDGMFANGDIVVFYKLKNATNDFIKAISGSALDINSDLTLTTLIPADVKPFIAYVKAYEEAVAVGVFQMAWAIYGQGKILPWSVMADYVTKVQNMANYFHKYDNTPEPFSSQIHIDWISLYGSPNPVHFPLMANNAITSLLFVPPKEYRFEVKKTVLDDIKPHNNCGDNLKVIETEIPQYTPIRPISGSDRTRSIGLMFILSIIAVLNIIV